MLRQASAGAGCAPAHCMQEYDPINLTLAEALQLLATKSRWSTARKDRRAAVQGLEAEAAEQPAAGEGELAAAAAVQGDTEATGELAGKAASTAADGDAPAPKKRGRKPKAEPAAAAQAASEEQEQQAEPGTAEQQEEPQPPKRKPGRPRKQPQPEAAAAQEGLGGKEQQGQRRRQQAANEQTQDAGDERQLATLAALQARLALDAAADIEVERLHVSTDPTTAAWAARPGLLHGAEQVFAVSPTGALLTGRCVSHCSWPCTGGRLVATLTSADAALWQSRLPCFCPAHPCAVHVLPGRRR